MDVKIRAAQDRRTMKDVTAEALRSWLNAGRAGSVSTGVSEPALTLNHMRRLEAFRAYRSHLEENPPSNERRALLCDYLAEVREDRQTFGGRDLAE